MNKLEKALRSQDRAKQDRRTELSGTMGVVINGVQTVEVPNRAGFVYVLLNTKEQELIQAFNDKVSAVFGLAVIVVWNVNRYEVLRKDDIRYGTWNSNYLPKHGNQHSFNPDGGGGGDVSFIYGKQFVPLSLTPSGTFGAPVAIVAPYAQQQSGWHYIPSTATPNITNHKPTDNQARMVLVCLDWNTRNLQLIIGTGTFAANLTGSADVIPYLPSTTGVYQVPIAGVRLVSGTTAVTWQNIYDVRQYFHPIFTGTSSGGGGGGGGITGSSYAIFGNTSSPNDQVNNGATVSPLNINTTFSNPDNLCTLSGDVLTFNFAGYYRIHVQLWVQTLSTFGNGELYAYVDTTSTSSLSYPQYTYLTAADSAKNNIYFEMDGTLDVIAGDTVKIAITNNTGGTVYASVFEVTIQSIIGGAGGTVNQILSSGLGITGWDEGVFLGTGTVLNFVGAGVTASISGTVINVNVPGGGGGSSIDTLGFAGMDEGIPLGTGTVLNVRGSRAVLSRSGTVFAFDVSPDPAELIGVYGLANGVPLGTGTWMDFGDNLTATISGTVLRVNAQAGGGGGVGVMAWDEGVPLGTGTVFNFVGNGVTATISGSVVQVLVTGSGGGEATGSANHGYYQYLAAMLEPLAIEELRSGAFSYAVGAGATKIALATFWTRLGSAGRWEARNPRWPVPLRGVTVTGLNSASVGTFIDPTLPVYSNAYDTYFDRLKTISETAPYYIGMTAPSAYYLFLPGPYGSIITSLTLFDFTWIVVHPYGTTLGWNLSDEIGDTGSTDYQRLGFAVNIPVSKNIASRLVTGAERSAGVGLGGLTYINCPSTWGKVTDPNTYDFRDDFMGASLDTSTKWTRSQSTAGNVEISTSAGTANWCKVRGNGAWGDNGMFSQTSVGRASGTVFMCDVYIPVNSPDIIVGWHDGVGLLHTDFPHCIDFTDSAGTNRLQVFENGNSRGLVGANPGYTANSIYRVKITLDMAAANSAKYEIQGGPEYQPIGGSSWTDITPGTTSSSTTPLHAGITVFEANDNYVGDVKIY